jgi:hypothetical protein
VSLRESLHTSFAPGEATGWLCSRCGLGHLVLAKEHLVTIETTDSVREREDDEDGNWDPSWIEERFVALLRCNHCNDPVTVAGTAKTEQQPPDGEYGTLLCPTFVRPAPRVLPRSDATPAKIENLLTRCEELFWSDSAGCVSAVRAVIEAILTHQRIKRYARSKAGRRTPIALHHRIVLFGKVQPGVAEKMLAVKWVGNAGSHDGVEPKRDDVFDAFDLLEHVLEEVYEKKSTYLAHLAKKIAKAKGPLSAKKNRKR